MATRLSFAVDDVQYKHGIPLTFPVTLEALLFLIAAFCRLELSLNC